MKRISSAAAGVLLLSASLGVQAQTSDMQLQMDKGFYIGAGAGVARTTRNGGVCVTTCDESDTSWNLSAGYQFNRHIGVELGYADLGTTTTSGTIFGVPATATVTAKVIELLGVATLPLSERFAIFGKFGVYRSKASSITSGGVTGTGRENDNGFTIAGGVQYLITPNFAARVELQSYSNVANGVIGLERDDIHVWRLGARYKF